MPYKSLLIRKEFIKVALSSYCVFILLGTYLCGILSSVSKLYTAQNLTTKNEPEKRLAVSFFFPRGVHACVPDRTNDSYAHGMRNGGTPQMNCIMWTASTGYFINTVSLLAVYWMSFQYRKMATRQRWIQSQFTGKCISLRIPWGLTHFW